MRVTLNSVRAHRSAMSRHVMRPRIYLHPTNSFLFLALLLPITFSLSGALATEWYVDDSVVESGNGQTWETAFKTVGRGISAAFEGDTVIVKEGTYNEGIWFSGKNITVRSRDPLDKSVVARTILQWSGYASVVNFWGGEDETCVLAGFTIQNGTAEYGGGICGGNHYRRTRATILNNTIRGNTATESGGGLAYCDGLIARNTICENSAQTDGGGLYDCYGLIRNNVIWGNTAGVTGGGLRLCGVTENNTIYGNQAGYQGGGVDGYGNRVNCILWGNKAPSEPQVYPQALPAYCCIERWVAGGEGNISYYPHFVDAENGDFRLASWSPCIDGGDPASEFAHEPDPNGGRIDIGAYGNTADATPKSPDTDADGLPDDWEMHFLGDLAQTGQDDPDNDRILNVEEYLRGYEPNAIPQNWYVDGAVETPGDGGTWETALKTIQEGIDVAAGGGHVVVAPGIYGETIQFKGEIIVLRSTDPLDGDVVANTIIDGGGKGAVVRFDGTESEVCTLSGFTIRNGATDSSYYYSRGGISGGTYELRTHATIENNIITANKGGGLRHCDGLIRANTISLNEAESDGGGLYECDGIINGNTILGNSAESDGGGLYACDGIVRDNIVTKNTATLGGGLADCAGVIVGNQITDNTALSGGSSSPGSGGGLALCAGLIEGNTVSGNAASVGGGLYRCDRVIRNNTVTENSAYRGGGGLADCDGLIQNNDVADNDASYGGGLFDCDGAIENNRISTNAGGGLSECDGLVQNNFILGNGASKSEGGGLARCDGTIQNNVIVGNAPGLQFCAGTIRDNTIVGNREQFGRYDGSALLACTGAITNCIIWGNEDVQILHSSQPTYSCIEDWSGGEGNISEDPKFIDPDGPDDDPRTYEDNDYRLTPDSPCIDAGFNYADLPETDILGNPRILYGGKIFTVDMGAYEYVIARLMPGPGPDEATFTWSSLAGRVYSVLYSEDLLNWRLADDSVLSEGNMTTSWIDDGSKTGAPVTLVPCRFYRARMNP